MLFSAALTYSLLFSLKSCSRLIYSIMHMASTLFPQNLRAYHNPNHCTIDMHVDSTP